MVRTPSGVTETDGETNDSAIPSPLFRGSFGIRNSNPELAALHSGLYSFGPPGLDAAPCSRLYSFGPSGLRGQVTSFSIERGGEFASLSFAMAENIESHLVE